MPDIPASLIAENLGLPWVDLEEVRPSIDALQLVPRDFALRNQVLPLDVQNGTLSVAIGSLDHLAATDDLTHV